jgi:hypothetical protein
MSEQRSRKMVLSRREMCDVSEDERARIRSLVDKLPNASITADFGPIVQVEVHGADGEVQLRSAIVHEPGWELTEEGVGEMPVETLTKGRTRW